MNLKHLTDKTLIEDTKILVSKEREVLVKLLHHLKEIDSRKLYSDLGFSSLFAYMTKGLGYSESAAGRRIQATRLLKTHPEIENKIEQGSLNLTNLNQVAFAFKNESLEVSSSKKDSIKVNSSSTFELKITIDDETKELIKVLQGLSKNQELNSLIKEALKTQIEIRKKKKFATFNTEEKIEPKSSPASGVLLKRTPTNQIKREVFIRDQKCQKCGSIHYLNFDHEKPFALGGSSSKENIRLLCSNCNQRQRIKMRL